MKLNYTIKLFSSVAAVVLLSACGDSDSSSSSDAPSLDPVVSYSVEKESEYNGKTVKMKLGANGDFKAVSGYSGYPELEFANEAEAPYTVSSLVEVESYGYEGSDDTVSGTITSDYAEGTEHIKAKSKEHGDVDCTNKYQSPLPFVLGAASDIDEVYFDEEQLISTTCPSWMNEEYEDEEYDESDDEYEEEVKAMEDIVNRTINGTSHISSYTSLK